MHTHMTRLQLWYRCVFHIEWAQATSPKSKPPSTEKHHRDTEATKKTPATNLAKSLTPDPRAKSTFEAIKDWAWAGAGTQGNRKLPAGAVTVTIMGREFPKEGREGATCATEPWAGPGGYKGRQSWACPTFFWALPLSLALFPCTRDGKGTNKTA
jgi:hypothetical protein